MWLSRAPCPARGCPFVRSAVRSGSGSAGSAQLGGAVSSIAWAGRGRNSWPLRTPPAAATQMSGERHASPSTASGSASRSTSPNCSARSPGSRPPRAPAAPPRGSGEGDQHVDRARRHRDAEVDLGEPERGRRPPGHHAGVAAEWQRTRRRRRVRRSRPPSDRVRRQPAQERVQRTMKRQHPSAGAVAPAEVEPAVDLVGAARTRGESGASVARPQLERVDEDLVDVAQRHHRPGAPLRRRARTHVRTNRSTTGEPA